jgi:predicted dehydrogenase
VTVGVGVIGTGFVASMHLAALAKLPEVRLIGVADVDAGRARGCIVCTPNDTHVDIGLAIASGGKHLLMEKPLAITQEGADQLVEAFEQRQLVLMGAHTHRFYDYGRVVKQTIDSGEIGRPVYARLAILGGWIWPDWHTWVIDPRRSGGHVLHNGVHLLDLATWWMGAAPESVYVQGRKETSGDLEIYDYLSMSVRYSGGATAILEMSRANRPRNFAFRDVFVQGTVGALRLPWDAEQGIAFLEGGTSLLPGNGQIGFDREVAAWIDAINGRSTPAVTGADARLAAVMAIAGEQSLRSGEVVRLA